MYLSSSLCSSRRICTVFTNILPRRSTRLYFSGPTRPHESVFKFWPTFFSPQEQKTLLYGCLRKLDSVSSRRSRRSLHRAHTNEISLHDLAKEEISLQSLFKPETTYGFLEGHFDGVITNYRESHVTSWPADVSEPLKPILRRLENLLPNVKTQTHVLHLGSEGEILPHIDNIEASGSYIVATSLGSTRILRMEHVEKPNEYFELLLPSGCVYLQRDEARYRFKHSILKGGMFRDNVPTGGQRISVMIRDVK